MLNGKLHSENKSKKDNFKAPESNKEVLFESHTENEKLVNFFLVTVIVSFLRIEKQAAINCK